MSAQLPSSCIGPEATCTVAPARAQGSAENGIRVGCSPLRGLLGDRCFVAILLIWAVCLAGWLAFLARYASPLPWCDEYLFIDEGIATGTVPVSWHFLWNPSNEHRQPLLRLWGVALGQAFNWDFRPMHHVNTVILAVAGLIMVLAVRSVRGRSEWADVFLPLLTLTPFHSQTLLFYSHANAVPLALWCLSACAVLVDWPFQSVPKLLLYLCLVLAVTWIGGPAGNLWAMGLAGVLAIGFVGRKSTAWNLCAVSGIALVVGSSLLMLANMPPPLGNGVFLSESTAQTMQMACKYSLVWMGDQMLRATWPWAVLVPLVPTAYLAGRLVAEARRSESSGFVQSSIRWFWPCMLAASTAVVAVALGRGRGMYPSPWESRYAVFAAPIVITLYFSLVHFSTPRVFTRLLAAWMAACFVLALPTSLKAARAHRARHTVLVQELRDGRRSLSALAEEMPLATGWATAWGTGRLVDFWEPMRKHGISVFAKRHGSPTDPDHSCILVHAEDGKLQAGLRTVSLTVVEAVRGRCVEAGADETAIQAMYEIDVPHADAYRLCCRWQCPAPGGNFTIRVNDLPPVTQSVRSTDRLVPYELEELLPLSAGKHRFYVTWPAAGARMDVLELTPQNVAAVVRK